MKAASTNTTSVSVPTTQTATAPQPRRWPWGRIILGMLGVMLVVLGVASYLFLRDELPSSTLQARHLSALGSQLSFTAEPGPSPLIRYPKTGPYDLRLGYVGLPDFIQRLRARGLHIIRQARFSPRLAQVVERGLFPPYHEKMQAGLRLFDQAGQTVFSTISPTRIYRDFDAIPPLVVQTLLFIENRELLDERYPQRNPAVEWDRFGLAVFNTLRRALPFYVSRPGGSTLATQLEKFRHSPNGLTVSVLEKLRQMGSASLRAYLDGPDTLPARRAIALAYVNSVPLGGIAGYGEIHGLGDGLWAWYGTDFATLNSLLRADARAAADTVSPERATMYRQVLSLLIAQRRPAWYLGDGYAALQTPVDGYLRLMAAQGVIPSAWRDAALQVQSPLRPRPMSIETAGATVSAQGFGRPVPLPPDAALGATASAQGRQALPFAGHKTASTLRARLAHDLGVTSLYDLDRLDVTVTSTIDLATQQAVTEALGKLRQPEQARAAGLFGAHLLSGHEDLNRLVYSFTLYERNPPGNLLRVNTDNYDQPLDMNDGIRLDLGSTAKLRTLVHYLQIIADLYQRYADQSPQTLRALTIDQRDALSRWVIERLQATPPPSLAALLEAALERRYAASPAESFFTGGSRHTFDNFTAADNSKILSVRQAFRDSVNLVFIRLMRDIVYHYLYRPGAIVSQLEGPDSRRAFLERFADREGQVFLRRFYAKYRGKSPEEAFDLLLQSMAGRPARLATVYRSVYPEHDLARFTSYMNAQIETPGLAQVDIAHLYDKYSPEHFDLRERGYIAHVHPLELWLVSYLVHHPQANLRQVVAASANERQEVYRWLFTTSRKHAQDTRIQALLELQAFTEIHQAWQRLGYPFETLTPSYASAIGASGDRPAALATLIGLLLNDGVQSSQVRFDTLHFASGTPYETFMARPPVPGERLLAPEVAAAARSVLVDVVEQGTARRLQGVYRRPDRQALLVGGKTGTGDHRRESYGAHGNLIGTSVVSRAATFVFFLGDRFFGAVTASVTGPEAARYHFTSALPVQVLKDLAPVLTPCLERLRAKNGQARGEPGCGPAPAIALSPQTGNTPATADNQARSAPDRDASRVTLFFQTGKTAPEAATPIRPKRSKMITITGPRPPLGRYPQEEGGD